MLMIGNINKSSKSYVWKYSKKIKLHSHNNVLVKFEFVYVHDHTIDIIYSQNHQ
jgi:hypothetical protein